MRMGSHGSLIATQLRHTFISEERKYSVGNRTTNGSILATYHCTEKNKPNTSREKTRDKQITVNKSHEQRHAKETIKSLLL